MGFLQNHAIKKSATGLSRELLHYVSIYLSQKNGDEDSYAFFLFEALKTYATHSPIFNCICPDFNPADFSDWKSLYSFILIRGVHVDLSYDPNIGTSEHNKLIVEVGFKELRDWASKMSNIY